MKATTFINAMHKSTNESTANQTMLLHDRSDLSKIFGEQGKIYAICADGIPEGIYYYLYPEVPEQGDFFETLKTTCDYWEGTENIAAAVGVDAAGQTVIVINIFE